MEQPINFDDFTYNQYKSNYIPAPIDELAVLGKTLDDKYSANKALYDEDNLLHVDAKDQDIPERNKILGGYTDQLAQTVKDNNGAYEKIGPQVSMITNRIHKDMTMGRLAAMQGNVASTSAYYKEVDDAVTKGNISPETGSKLKAEAEHNYQGIGDGGANGVYNRYSGILPTKEVNIDEKAAKLIEGWKSDKNQSIPVLSTLPSGAQVYTQKTVESASPSEIRDAALKALNADPEVNSYLNQDTRLNNPGSKYPNLESYIATNGLSGKEKPEDYANELRAKHPNLSDNQFINYLDPQRRMNEGANFASNKYGFTNVERSWRFDPAWEEAQKNKQDKKDNPDLIFPNENAATAGSIQTGDQIQAGVKANQEELKNLNTLTNNGQSGNPQDRQRRQELQNIVDIQNSTLKNAANQYANSSDGKNALQKAYQTMLTLSKNGDFGNNPNQPTYGEFEAAVNKGYNWTDRFKSNPNLLGFYNQTVQQTKDYLSKGGMEVQNSNPKAYTANVLTGTTFDKDVNEPLTKRVTENSTNYILPDGTQLDQFVNDKMPKEGGTLHVSALDQPIDGIYAHQLTIKDKNERTVATVPIYPKNTEDEATVGNYLMKKYYKQDDVSQRANYQRGLNMSSHAAFGNVINDKLEDDYQGQGGYGDSRKFDLNINGMTGEGFYMNKSKIKNPTGKTQEVYTLYGSDGKPVTYKDSDGKYVPYNGLSQTDVRNKLYLTTNQ